jgi:hypothetical protein
MTLKKLLSTVFTIAISVGSIVESHGAASVLTEAGGIGVRLLSRYAACSLVRAQAVRHYSQARSTKVSIGNPCIDGVFQYGLNDSFIASQFLNSILDLKDGACITDVMFLPRDLPSSDPLAAVGYNFTVDARCQTQDGRHFLVEMQNDFRSDYHLKALIEHSRMIGRIDLEQTRRVRAEEPKAEEARPTSRKFWHDVQGIYSIVITNKVFAASRFKAIYPTEPLMEPDLTNVYELRNVRWLNRHYGDIPNQIVLLMLANLKERPLRELSSVERWAYLFQDKGLRYGARRIEEVKEIEDPEEVAAGDKAIERFIQRLDLRHLPQEVVDRYHSAIQYYNDTIVDIEEKGMTKGIAKGEKKKAIDIAKKMLKRNRPIEEIMEDTELTREEVEAIRAGRVLKDDSVANSEDGSTSAN